MKIGVSGASGHLGQAVVAELLQRDGSHGVVGISRTPQSIRGPAEGRFGDYDTPSTLERAYEGLDRLLLIPSAELRSGVRGRQLQGAIDAAIRAGVKHLFFISAAGTHHAVAPEMGEAFWTAEQHLIRTSPAWTILRMNYYAESIADEIKMGLGSGVLAGLGDERVAYVSRNDLAAAATGALLGEGHQGAIYNVTGPAVVTGPERAAIVSAIVGKPVNFITITVEQLRSGLAQAGLPEVILDAMTEIKINFVKGKLDIVTGDTERLSGRPPKALRDILAASLA